MGLAINLEVLARVYEKFFIVALALTPSIAIWYLTTFSPTPLPEFESHGFHEFAITAATAIGLFVS